MTEAAEREHLGWLDALRGFAALWVVGCHALGTVGFVPTNLPERLFHRFLDAGHFAVTAFIALSGFSLALAPGKNGWRFADGYREFIVARWVRIAPPFYASTALSLLLIATLIGHKTGTHWDVSIPVHPASIVEHLLLVQNFAGAPEINHAYWSVAIEFQIYLFFGLFLWGMRRKAEGGVLAVGLGLSAASVLLHFAVRPLVQRGWLSTDHFYPAAYLLVFAFGVVACARAGRPFRRARGALVLVAGALMVGGTQLPSEVLFFPDVLFGLGTSLILLLLATRETPLGPGRLLAWQGRRAYSLYLTHAPIVQVVYVLGRGWRPMGSFAASLGFAATAVPVTILIASGFYLAVERPSFRLRHFLQQRRRMPLR